MEVEMAKNKKRKTASEKSEAAPSPKTTKEETPKQLTVPEIIGMMNASSSQLQTLQAEITKLDEEVETLKTQRAELRKQIKPIRKSVKKFNPDGITYTPVAPHDRKAIRLQIKVLTNQIILKEDSLATIKAAFAKYSDSVSAMMKKSELVNKAQSKNWTKRNRWSIEARIVKTLNKISVENIAILQDLARMANSETDDSKVLFDTKLQKTLDDFDAETSILCSYELKNDLYAVIYLTLKNWDSEKVPAFEKLVVVED